MVLLFYTTSEVYTKFGIASEGRVSGELPLDQISEERIMALTSGMKIDTKEYAL